MRWVMLGAVFCGLSVGLGAFAAHSLDSFFADKYADQTRTVAGQTVPLATKYLNDFKTGAEYQMYHGLAIIAAGLMWERRASHLTLLAALAFSIGIILFSGSLYILTLTGARIWGAVVPLGGVSFLIGWLCLALAALTAKTLERLTTVHNLYVDSQQTADPVRLSVNS